MKPDSGERAGAPPLCFGPLKLEIFAFAFHIDYAKKALLQRVIISLAENSLEEVSAWPTSHPANRCLQVTNLKQRDAALFIHSEREAFTQH